MRPTRTLASSATVPFPFDLTRRGLMSIEVTQLHCETIDWSNPTTETAPQEKTLYPFRPKSFQCLRSNMDAKAFAMVQKAVSPILLILKVFTGIILVEASGGKGTSGRAWGSPASAKIGNVPLTYCQYRSGLVGQIGPMERGIASALSGKTFIVQGS